MLSPLRIKLPHEHLPVRRLPRSVLSVACIAALDIASRLAPVVGTTLKTLALLSPFAVVVVTLVNDLQASRAMIGVLVFSLAVAGVALGAIFSGDSASPH